MTINFSRRVAMVALGATALTPVLESWGAAKTSRKSPVRYDTSNGEWKSYSGSTQGLRYSALNAVNEQNFNQLALAWTFAEPGDVNLEATPLVANGVLYNTAGLKRAVVALDAKTGAQKWRFDFDEGHRGETAPRPGSGHGVSYWTDGDAERIIYVTIGYQMISLDAKTGEPDPAFGVNGVVDLKQNDDQDINIGGDGAGQEIGLHSTPLVMNDVVVVGAAHSATVRIAKHVKGFVRGFDVKTGKRLWIFHTVPKKGEFGYDTWLNGSAETGGNTANWGQNSADPELGLVYLTIEQPTDDYFGAFRPGNNLFSDCLVALDVKTGKRRWYYQTVHHDIWDRDLMCAPMLYDMKMDGRTIKAMAIPTKQAFTFVLDRTNGKPVWPIPETPVPIGDVPGEWYSPTQPIPSKPPAFDVQGLPLDQIIDFTPALREEALGLLKNYHWGGLFAPPIVSQWPDKLGTIQIPSTDGAAQWPGGALDPETNVMYIFSNHAYAVRGLLPGDFEKTGLSYISAVATAPRVASVAEDGQGAAGRAAAPAGRSGRGGGRLTVQGLSILKPPYGRMTAIDLNKGEILWQIAHGETPDDVKNHPALKGIDIPRTGSLGKVGTLVTKTLVIAGDGTMTTAPDGRRGAWLRAYDKATGREVGQVHMPARVTGSPMTYAIDGEQYIAVPISGPPAPAQLAVYKLPA